MTIRFLREGTLSEGFVQRRFEISPSKLRAAQRLRLIGATIQLSEDRRYTRFWDVTSVSKVWYADRIAHYAQIPFIATCEALLFYQQVRGIDIGEQLKLDEFERVRSPLVYIYDRYILCYFDPSYREKQALGRLLVGTDGRMMFAPDLEVEPPRRGKWTSLLKINCDMIRMSLMQILEDIERELGSRRSNGQSPP